MDGQRYMQKKETLFQEWVKEITSSWKHVPSLKGKQAERYLGTLKILVEAKTMLSTWDLALEYLRLTRPKLWSVPEEYRANGIKVARQVENSQMNRSLKFLSEKHYVVKEDTQYRLSFKGFFLLLILDPTEVTERGKFNVDCLKEDLGKDNVDKIVEFGIEPTEEFGKTESVVQFVGSLKDRASADALSAFYKRKLFGWKVNLDDISPSDLANLIISHLPNIKRRNS